MFKSLSLKTKLISLCVFLSSLTVVVGGVAWYTANISSTAFLHVAEVNLPNTNSLALMHGSFKEVRIHLRTVGLTGITRDQIEGSLDRVKKSIMAYEEADKVYTAVPFYDEEQALYDKVNTAWRKFKSGGEAIASIALSTKPEDVEKVRSFFFNECPEHAEEYGQAIGALIDFHNKQAKTWVKKAEDAEHTGSILTITLSAVSFALALLIGLLFSNYLANGLKQLADNLAAGATDVATASKSISEAGAELSASATEQAAALQQTVASIDEVSAMVSKNADNAKRSQDVAAVSQQAATRGKQSVEQMLVSIEDINQSNTDIMQQTEASNQEISSIVKVIAEIGNKTKVINDIVFQTKLLSFNASVEAARAGEHGKGFAVVAEEVGNLAQMSGNAAKEISQMLEESIRKVEKTVTDTKSKIERLIATGKDKIEVGMVTARRCGDSLEEIVKNVSDLTSMVDEISTASQEQAQGVQEITKAMGQLDQVTQQNAASSEQSASASEQLNGQATSLHSMVSTLVQTVQGAGNGRASGPDNSATVKPSNQKNNAQVVPFKRKSPPISIRQTSGASSMQKLAAGGEMMPSDNDPRFEDV